MSKLRFLLPLVLVTLLIPGCNAVNAQLDKEFSLHTGQIGYIASENLSIDFVGIADDSRCPTGVTCIWAGQVVIDALIKLTREHTQEADLILYQSGGSDFSKQAYDVYVFTYSVDPYPVAGKTIPKGSYIMHMTVTKQQ